MGEEQVVDVGGPEAGLDELVGSGGTAVEHDFFAVDVGDVSGAEAGGGRCRGAGAEDVEGGGEFVVGHGGWVMGLSALYCAPNVVAAED